MLVHSRPVAAPGSRQRADSPLWQKTAGSSRSCEHQNKMKNIDWKQLSPSTPVRDTGVSYIALLPDDTEASVCWGSRDATVAQRELDRMVRLTDLRISKKEPQSPIMQAIRTKYHGATNTRSSRITATSSSGIKCTVPFRHELDIPQNHRAAAEALCEKLDWPCKLTQGALKDSHVFVFAE